MRFQLEGPSLREIQDRAIAEYGPYARIVSAEKVTVGGIGGFLSRTHLEAIIEVPDDHAPAGNVMEPGEGTPRSPESFAAPREPEFHSLPVPAAPRHTASRNPASGAHAGGIDGLLERADAAELSLAPPESGPTGELPPLPGRPDFARLLDGQAFALEPASGSRAAGTRAGGPRGTGPDLGQEREPFDVPETGIRQAGTPDREILPVPLSGPGDLVVVIGLWGDGGAAAGELDGGTALRRNAGDLAQKFDAQSLARKPITDRRGILRARAAAVAEGVALVVSVAINPLQALYPQLELLGVLEADQLWVSVDAGRKASDTAAWVKHVDSRFGIYAVVALHANETLSPETVWELGFPVLDARGQS